MTTIGTWSELRAHIYSMAAIAAEGPSWVGFRHDVDGLTLQMKIAQASDDLLLVMAAACPERELPPRRAMLEASQLIPSVVIEDGFYVVRHWLRLGASAAQVSRAVSLVADAAMRLRAHAQPRERVTGQRPFMNFAE